MTDTTCEGFPNLGDALLALHRSSIRRLLNWVRIALGNLALLAILLSSGPLLANESAEANNLPAESKESTTKEAVVGIQHRLVRIRLLWSAAQLLPALRTDAPTIRPVPRSIVGHTLSNELLAPLRC
jgi:hypothetical protein